MDRTKGADMRITILGGGGFLGRKIAMRLARDRALGGRPVTSLTLFDLREPAGLDAPFPVSTVAGDVVDLPMAAIPIGTDVVFHLAAVVSAQAEADYALGRRVNLRGTDAVIDACRRQVAAGGPAPRVVFTSSVASFSGSQGVVLDDDAKQVPANSYGAQKAAAELVLADASRRGFMDVVTLRLPTVIVRPGRPNKAASGFFSGIVREPLLGLETELPVDDAFAAWFCSPRRAVDWLLHAAALDTTGMGLDRSLSPPGISATIRELIAALEAVSPGASRLIRRAPDPAIAAIVGTWPAAFTATRARALGFAPHEPATEIVRAFVEDDLAATKADRGL